MTNEMLACVVAAKVDKAMRENEDGIVKGLADGLASDDYVDPVMAQIVVKAMRLSAQISAQVAIRFMELYADIELPADGAPLLRLSTNDDRETT